MFCNFREVQPESRGKMRLHYPEAYQRLLNSEIAKNGSIGPIWIKISDWSGILDHMAPERPSGAGQIIRRDDPAKKARIA